MSNVHARRVASRTFEGHKMDGNLIDYENTYYMYIYTGMTRGQRQQRGAWHRNTFTAAVDVSGSPCGYIDTRRAKWAETNGSRSAWYGRPSSYDYTHISWSIMHNENNTQLRRISARSLGYVCRTFARCARSCRAACH